MVNYDLPWNPNRIEQRFGRIHRIGQDEVCRLWNLVATNTREGEVFTRLLEKIEEQRKAYGGKVFDVLGEAFTETPLRNLLLEAIQYGERPDVQAKMHEVIDASVGDGLKELLDERALASEHLAEADLARAAAAMDEARARRLQPHYIELAFKAAFTRLGGRIAKREQGRYEIANVPAARPLGRQARTDRHQVRPSHLRPEPRPAERPAPRRPARARTPAARRGHGRSHPQLRRCPQPAARSSSRRRWRSRSCSSESSRRSPTRPATSVARRFGYAYVDSFGTVSPAGPAPYLDCVAAPAGPVADAARRLRWLADAEDKAMSWIIANQLPEYLAEVQPRRLAELDQGPRPGHEAPRAQRRDRLLLDAAVASREGTEGREAQGVLRQPQPQGGRARLPAPQAPGPARPAGS